MADDARLLAALAIIQARGAIGERSLIDAVAHADRFVELLPAGSRSVIDLGSGGGLPALVISWRRSDVHVTMVERRTTRADMLRRAIVSLELGDRAAVVDADVSTVVAASPASFDVVTARSFGDLATTTRVIDALLAPGGLALVSEPPIDRSREWTTTLSEYPNLVDDGVHQGIRRLRRRP
ncbi:MAG: RsmG family class I SAM-dependent methyltransferase [Ilumatobacteraceae bacterium]